MVTIFIPPILAAVIFFLHSRTPGAEEMTRQLMIIILLLVPLTVGSVIFFRYIMNRQISTLVEITEEGINHIAPGKTRNFLWNEVKKIKLVPANKTKALRLILEKGGYTFEPNLTPDEPGAPQITFGMMGMKWKFVDGTTMPADIKFSVGYKAVMQYRPDLLDGVKV